jgi:hypothetical protein
MERRWFGPIVRDIEEQFFNLTPQDFADLIKRYEQQYGRKAREYAEKTYLKWNSGPVRISGQTARRLINLVPRYIPTSTRFEIVRRLCEFHARRYNYQVTIEIENPMPGLSQLDGYVNELLAVPMLKDLPQHILDDINWLNDDDVIAAREMLANLDRRLNETRVMYARQELARIHGLLSENKDMNGHYRMEFINGTINVRFERKPEPFSLFRWLCS